MRTVMGANWKTVPGGHIMQRSPTPLLAIDAEQNHIARRVLVYFWQATADTILTRR